MGARREVVGRVGTEEVETVSRNPYFEDILLRMGNREMEHYLESQGSRGIFNKP